MLIPITLIFFYLAFPVLIIYLTRISKTINKIGAVVMAYLIGMLLGNIGLLPRASIGFHEVLAGKTSLPASTLISFFEQGQITETDLMVNQVLGVQEWMTNLTILLAIPLLLFSLDLKRWLKLAKGALFSLFLGISSLLIVIFLGNFIFHDLITDSWKVSGMLIGIYTGGAPNLAAISAALNAGPNLFILTNTYDMVLGAFCLMFLLTIAQRFFNLFLPKFQDSHRNIQLEKVMQEGEDIGNYQGMLTRQGMPKLLKAFGLSLIISAVGGVLSLLVPERVQMTVVILSITTLGLFFSTFKSINQIEKTFQLGMYFIIVFSMVVASMGDLVSMFSIEFLHLFLFVALGVFGSMIVHVFLSWIFKVDSDTTIITITALTYSPPFVPVVAGALKNKDVIISGLTVGILGYAFGNYLGVAVAYFLKGF